MDSQTTTVLQEMEVRAQHIAVPSFVPLNREQYFAPLIEYFNGGDLYHLLMFGNIFFGPVILFDEAELQTYARDFKGLRRRICGLQKTLGITEEVATKYQQYVKAFRRKTIVDVFPDVAMLELIAKELGHELVIKPDMLISSLRYRKLFLPHEGKDEIVATLRIYHHTFFVESIEQHLVTQKALVLS